LGAVKRRSDGRWEGQLRLADGARRYVYAHNRDELITQLQEERWRITNGIPRKATGLTLSQYLPEWLEVCRGRLRPKTFDSYVLCAHRVELQLGRVPLSRLNPMIIQSAYARLQAGGLSPRTVFQTHAVLHRVHDLRHTTATVLLEAGAHPKLVQDLLGHSTVALTPQYLQPCHVGTKQGGGADDGLSIGLSMNWSRISRARRSLANR